MLNDFSSVCLRVGACSSRHFLWNSNRVELHRLPCSRKNQPCGGSSLSWGAQWLLFQTGCDVITEGFDKGRSRCGYHSASPPVKWRQRLCFLIRQLLQFQILYVHLVSVSAEDVDIYVVIEKYYILCDVNIQIMFITITVFVPWVESLWK